MSGFATSGLVTGQVRHAGNVTRERIATIHAIPPAAAGTNHVIGVNAFKFFAWRSCHAFQAAGLGDKMHECVLTAGLRKRCERAFYPLSQREREKEGAVFQGGQAEQRINEGTRRAVVGAG